MAIDRNVSERIRAAYPTRTEETLCLKHRDRTILIDKEEEPLCSLVTHGVQVTMQGDSVIVTDSGGNDVRLYHYNEGNLSTPERLSAGFPAAVDAQTFAADQTLIASAQVLFEKAIEEAVRGRFEPVSPYPSG